MMSEPKKFCPRCNMAIIYLGFAIVTSGFYGQVAIQHPAGETLFYIGCGVVLFGVYRHVRWVIERDY